ncbi:iron ABC transporter permease [Sporomusa sphaeroides DSM 2875]|uniref:FecCD family ABC transporter permease n=1 Tax=Sporomusa sphaeroides TaxID=47679 RepID=UPI0020308B0D|nr:iron ABC transporter permease [Sporomusa sphaeroides]MCM0757818.1 iron ABC transporter permease [Sporomusa sphaeroides DSM 2875]
MGKKIGNITLLVVLILLPVVFFIASLMLGPYPIGPFDVVKIVLDHFLGTGYVDNPLAENMIWKIRMPRILGAVLVGAALSVAGAVFQGLFRNPLASPYTLGVSNGAGFGAALAILLSSGAGLNVFFVQLSALAFGLLSIGITFLLAAKARRSTVTLVLSGMLVGALFSSLVALIKYVADPYDQLPQIVFWLMGTLSGVTYEKLAMILPLYLPAMTVIFLMRWRINILSMGDQEARSYGVDVKKNRTLVILACSVLTALVVSLAGVIGWVGIVIPHLARIIAGHDFRKLVPVSLSLGICYVLLIDDICRNVTAAEIPLGVVTGIIGTPVFIYFIYKGKVRWE